MKHTLIAEINTHMDMDYALPQQAVIGTGATTMSNKSDSMNFVFKDSNIETPLG